jgi:hypothetical protein
MSAQTVFNFSARFLSAALTPAPHARKSKLLTRREEMRRRSEWGCDKDIATAPAMTDINVVATVPEVAEDVGASVMSPVMVAAESTTPESKPTGTTPTAAAVTSIKIDESPASAIKRAHDDRDAQNSSSAENANWGIPPRNDTTGCHGNAASGIVPAAEITGTSQPMAIVPVAPVDASNTIRCPIPPAMVADVLPPSLAKKKVRRRSNKAKVDGLGGSVKKKLRRKSGKLAGAVRTAPESDDQDMLPGYDLGGTSGAHSPP